jgi:hypothetical protein
MQPMTRAQKAKAGITKAATSKAGKAGGWAAVALAALIGGAQLVNSLTSEHTVANRVTDQLLCVLYDPSKCVEAVVKDGATAKDVP